MTTSVNNEMKFPSTKISNKHCKKNTSNIFYDETLIISNIKYVGRELCIDFVAQALVPFKKYMPLLFLTSR